MFWIWNRRKNFVFNNFWIFLSVITICIILRQTFHGNGQTPHFGDLSHTLVVSCGFFPAQCSTSRLRLYTFAQVGHLSSVRVSSFSFIPFCCLFCGRQAWKSKFSLAFVRRFSFSTSLAVEWGSLLPALHPPREGNSSCRALHGKSSSTDFRELVDSGWGG